MRNKKEIYIFSSDGVNFKKKSFFHFKISLFAVFFTTILIFGALFVNNKFKFFDTSFIGVISYETENQLLKNELKITNDKIVSLLEEISSLNSSDNEMRKIVNLPSKEKKEFGFGGVVKINTEAILSREANDVLSSSKELIDELESKIKIQHESYKEIYQKSEENKIYFSSIPAIRPMAGHYATHGGFGVRMHPILGVKRMHEGIDITNDVGTPIYATGNGIINEAGRNGNFGISIMIDHGFGFESLYAHLSKTIVNKNQRVSRGELIGYSGNSGLSSGPHLHYEVRLNGKNIDPKTYFIDGVGKF